MVFLSKNEIYILFLRLQRFIRCKFWKYNIQLFIGFWNLSDSLFFKVKNFVMKVNIKIRIFFTVFGSFLTF